MFLAAGLDIQESADPKFPPFPRLSNYLPIHIKYLGAHIFLTNHLMLESIIVCDRFHFHFKE